MDFDLEDIALAGALAEEMTEEERERIRIKKEMEIQDMPDENEDKPDDMDIEEFIP